MNIIELPTELLIKIFKQIPPNISLKMFVRQVESHFRGWIHLDKVLKAEVFSQN